jgi:hypothetical protein
MNKNSLVVAATGACAVALLSFLSGCNQSSAGDGGAQKIASLEERTTALNTQLNAANNNILTLQGQVMVLNAEVQMLLAPDASVVLDPTTRAYSIVKTNLGQLLVSVVDFSPYLNGYKLKLAVGNPSFVTYNGAKLAVRWGTAPSWGKKDFDGATWNQSLQTKELSITNSILPGAWNNVEVVVAPATAEQTAYLALSINLDQVALRSTAQ